MLLIADQPTDIQAHTTIVLTDLSAIIPLICTSTAVPGTYFLLPGTWYTRYQVLLYYWYTRVHSTPVVIIMHTSIYCYTCSSKDSNPSTAVPKGKQFHTAVLPIVLHPPPTFLEGSSWSRYASAFRLNGVFFLRQICDHLSPSPHNPPPQQIHTWRHSAVQCTTTAANANETII